jgi:large subunit ribosomal protein L30
MGSLTVVQRRSANGCNQRQLDTLRSLGLRRIGHTVEVGDSPQARGMLHAVRHLVEVSDQSAADTGRPAAARAKSSASDTEVSR